MTSVQPTHPQSRLTGWPLFFLLSLLIHLAFLLLWPTARASLAGQLAESNLAVTLLDAPITPSPAVTQPVQHTAKRPARPAPPPATQAAEPAQVQTTAAPQPAVTATVQMPREVRRFSGNSAQMSASLGQEMLMEPPAQADDAASETLSGQIRTRFAEHFSYPLLAQRNGWEGEVVLAFRVENDGTLSAIRIIRSSGHTLLDQAAMASMQAIGKIEFTDGMVLQRTLELRMPIIYHLAQR